MKIVTLTIKKSKEPAFDRWDIKNGRKSYATIYQLRTGEDAGRYQICKNGLAFYRDTLEDSKAFAIEQAESFLNMMSFNCKVEIVEK